MSEKISTSLAALKPAASGKFNLRWLSGKIYLISLERRRLQSRTLRKGEPAPSSPGSQRPDFPEASNIPRSCLIWTRSWHLEEKLSMHSKLVCAVGDLLSQYISRKKISSKFVSCREWIKRKKTLEEHQCNAASDSSTAQKCCYCEALKTTPEDCSGAMRAMMESENLQLDASKLLLSSRASTPSEEMQRLKKASRQDNSKEADLLTQVKHPQPTLCSLVTNNERADYSAGKRKPPCSSETFFKESKRP